MKRRLKTNASEAWSSTDSRILGMTICPVITLVIVGVALNTGRFASGVFYSLASLGLLAAVIGMVSGAWILFGRSSIILRASAALFTTFNLLALNGIVGLLQR